MNYSRYESGLLVEQLTGSWDIPPGQQNRENVISLEDVQTWTISQNYDLTLCCRVC